MDREFERRHKVGFSLDDVGNKLSKAVDVGNNTVSLGQALFPPSGPVVSLYDHVSQHVGGIGDLLGAAPTALNPLTGKPYDLFSLLGVPVDAAGQPIDMARSLVGLFDLQNTADKIEASVKNALTDFFNSASNILEKPLKDLENQDNLLKDFLTKVVSLLKDIVTTGGPFEDLLKAVVPVLTHIVNTLGKDLKDLVRELAKFLVRIWAAVVSDVGDLLKGTTSLITDISEAFRKLVGVIVVFLFQNLLKLVNLPSPIQCGLRTSFQTLIEVGDPFYAAVAGGSVSLADRAAAVGASLTTLGNLLADSQGTAGVNFLFKEALAGFVGKIEAAIRLGAAGGSPTPDAIIAEFIGLFVDPSGLFQDVFNGFFDAAAKQRVGFWIDFPCGLPTNGVLQAWVNDAAFKGGANAIQREYRVRLLAAIDAYLRAKIDIPNLPSVLAQADMRASARIASDLLSVFLNTTILFILEPECFPAGVRAVERAGDDEPAVRGVDGGVGERALDGRDAGPADASVHDRRDWEGELSLA
jgi:hypothetical protein